jgi:hypothetical protein
MFFKQTVFIMFYKCFLSGKRSSNRQFYKWFLSDKRSSNRQFLSCFTSVFCLVNVLQTESFTSGFCLINVLQTDSFCHVLQVFSVWYAYFKQTVFVMFYKCFLSDKHSSNRQFLSCFTSVFCLVSVLQTDSFCHVVQVFSLW